MAGPDVTIAIPARDRPQLAARAIASALAQSVKDLEVVVVDDGSAEPLHLPVRDGRLRIIRRERAGGPCTARNMAMSAARGRWITFLDDDEELAPEMVAVSLRAIRASTLPGPVAALCGVEVVDEDGRVLETRLPTSVAKGGHYPLEDGQRGRLLNTLVAPLEVMRRIGGWDEGLPAWEHDDLLLRLNAVCSIQGVPTVAYRVSAHAGPRLSNDLPARARGIERTLTKHRTAFAAHPTRHAYLLGTLGLAHLRGGRWAPAVAATTRSLMIQPGLRACGWWVASLAGPWATSLCDRVRARLAEGRHA